MRSFVLFLLLLFAIMLAGCSTAPTDDSLLEADAPPTRLPITPTPNQASLNLAQNAAPQVVRATLTPLPSPTPWPTEAPIMPEVDRINTWLRASPSPEWTVLEGIDGILITRDPAIQGTFLSIRRWSSPLTIQDWVAYFPEGVAERNSNVSIQVGGREWDGVFVSAADGQWRAFFAISGTVPAYSLLVYVPIGLDINDATRLAVWDTEATPLNEILFTVAIQ